MPPSWLLLSRGELDGWTPPLLLPLARAHYRQSLDPTAVCFGPILERRREAFVENESFQIFLGNAHCREQRRGASQGYYRFRAE